MTQHHDGSRAALERTVKNLIEKLQQEELIVFEQADALTSTNSSREQTGAGKKVSFEPPILQKYTGMEDLLLLNPI